MCRKINAEIKKTIVKVCLILESTFKENFPFNIILPESDNNFPLKTG